MNAWRMDAGRMLRKGRPDPNILQQILRYDPDTGKLFWKFRPLSMFAKEQHWKTWNKRFAGKEALTAFCNADKKYKHGYVFGAKIKAHQAAWALFYGSYAKHQLDHINGNGLDNRICNLRDVPQSENNKNLSMPLSNSSGVVGVSWCKSKRKWRAQISKGNKTLYLGRFNCFWLAVLRRRSAEMDLGFHKNHGRQQIEAQS